MFSNQTKKIDGILSIFLCILILIVTMADTLSP